MRVCSSTLFTWRSAVTDPNVGPVGVPGLVSRRTLVHVAVTGLSLHMSPEGGDCWPSVPRIAAETGLNERTVERAVKALTRQGWLSVRRGGGRGRSNRYQVGFPQPVQTLAAAAVNGGSVPLFQPEKGGSEPPILEERAAAATERAAATTEKGGSLPPEFFSRSTRGPSDQSSTGLDNVSSLSARRARRDDPPEEWVRVWWWARQQGETRAFPQLGEALRVGADTLSYPDYLRLRNAWVQAGAPEVFDPRCLVEHLNFSVRDLQGAGADR